MPCVLPMVSLKLFGLIKLSQKTPQEIWHHNFLYSAGILSTFSIMAISISLLQSAGQEVGWGLHLQSPSFVLVMLLICFILSLNLFGLYEFRLPQWVSKVTTTEKESSWEAFGSGVLSTILSTPCTAPFLGSALAVAFVSPFPVILCLFLGIGLGLSTPFLLIGAFPHLINYLPKPGLWMDSLKKIMGFFLLLTVCWLFDVLSKLTVGQDLLLPHLAFFLCVFFSFYIHHWKSRLLRLGFLMTNIFILISLFMMYSSPVSSLTSTKTTQQGWSEWSVEKLSDYKNKRQKVFMDFTAAWCLTCKVNEKLVLSKKEFHDLARDHKVELLLADWTNKDLRITKWLKEHGVSGVPAYFYQDEEGAVHFLGEVLTMNKLKEYFQR
jgi:thiol:disulfide interchange protein